jgi:hypothetical protein
MTIITKVINEKKNKLENKSEQLLVIGLEGLTVSKHSYSIFFVY